MADVQFEENVLAKFKKIVSAAKKNPEILKSPQLLFLREYLESLGASIPDFKSEETSEAKAKKIETEDEHEPYPELDEEGVIDQDEVDASQVMGDPDKTPSEDEMAKSGDLRMSAADAFSQGNYEEAVKKYTEAITLNGGAAALFAKRGQAYLKLNKPNACVRDCSHALQINPDSAIAYKFRGRAHRMLGHWEQSASDLRQACKIDFDEQADEWLKEVTPNARKLEDYKIRLKRKQDENEMKRRHKLMEERAKAHEEAKKAEANRGDEGRFSEDDGGFDDYGKIPMLEKLMKDPAVLALLSDPEVAAAFEDVKQNPMNFLKYQSNPKVMKLMSMFSEKLGGTGGMPGFGGAGFGAPPPGHTTPSSSDDLD